jgi:hypothetical protein
MTKNTKIPSHLNKTLDCHFLTCSAMVTGAAVILPTPAASGGIIFSGTQNLPIFPSSVNGGVYFDLEPPFGTSQGPTRVAGWDFNPYSAGSALYVNSNTALVLSVATVANLPANTLIDGSSNFSKLQFYGGVDITEGNTGYVGFKFDPDGTAGIQTLYGWVQMTVGGTTFGNGKIVAWAYEDSGSAIRAGAIPEPNSLLLLALGAAGVASWRRRAAA